MQNSGHNPLLILIICGWWGTAIGTHFRSRRCRDAAGKVVWRPHWKVWHQFFHFTLADRAIYLWALAGHEAIKFVVAFFTVVFINRHDFSPNIVFTYLRFWRENSNCPCRGSRLTARQGRYRFKLYIKCKILSPACKGAIICNLFYHGYACSSGRFINGPTAPPLISQINIARKINSKMVIRPRPCMT